jgi:ribosomal protein L16 Arg81 hydroxylase
MGLEQMLGAIPKAQFVKENFHRLPFTLPHTARPFCEFMNWDVLRDILGQEAADVMVVRNGRQCAEATSEAKHSARALVDQGHTILVRHAERHNQQLGELALQFARDFQAPVDVHVYITPPGQHGFPWHYDAEDVFIIQTAGEKEYSLRKNTVHPWPLVETIPIDMRYPREITPLMRVLLAPGDWLYIPCGYWHKAEARDCGEPAMSIALGVLSPSAIDLLDHLRARLLDSLLWRGRLPVSGNASSESPEEVVDRYRELIALLTDDLRRTLSDSQFLASFVERQSRRSVESSRSPGCG